jgi:hypothetical protein
MLLLALVVAILSLLSFTTVAPQMAAVFDAIILGSAILLVVLAGIAVAAVRKAEVPEKEEAAPTVRAAAPPPPAPEAADHQAAMLLLQLLQEKGRLVDFVMEDITSYNDQQIGAAARVVHQGCRQLVQDAFDPEPISSVPEDSSLTIEEGYSAEEYRLVGNVSGQPPYQGKLVHKGWKARQVKLPRVNRRKDEGEQRIIQPAEVEL